MRVTHLFIILFVAAGVLSCSSDGNADSLKAKELELKQRELDLQKKERAQEMKQKANDAQADLTSLKWENYFNTRFEFCVDYPSSFLRPQGESENNDGNVFATTNGTGEMRVSGIYNVLDESIAEAFKSATAKNQYYDADHQITYKVQKGDWFVISGKYFESIFYVKTKLKGDTFYTISFEYHPSEKKQFDEIIKRTTKNFPEC